ncbi:hypothetical protein [Fusobacterium mortiferum]|uniref:Spermidine synthase n=1 Tax=Fusobacterium mortiferum TaxID=850 RepID=A0ABS2G4I5_FUSMR|nr:hypothetical protein [Fusobacterium mortiferum]MBM6875940.1 hypothetical protein [Fusobacterium mortiferum]
MNFTLEHLKNETIGDWRIETFEIPENFAKMRNFFIKNPLMKLEGGIYKKLVNKLDGVIMSNTPMEQRTHIKAINKAQGNVLVAGLGLGMYLQNIKDKEEVTSITVVEKSKEVIELVAKYFKDCQKIRIVNEDIFNYTPDIKFDFAFLDIWSDISEDNLVEFNILREKFKEIPEIICWSEDIIELNKLLEESSL